MAPALSATLFQKATAQHSWSFRLKHQNARMLVNKNSILKYHIDVYFKYIQYIYIDKCVHLEIKHILSRHLRGFLSMLIVPDQPGNTGVLFRTRRFRSPGVIPGSPIFLSLFCFHTVSKMCFLCHIF